MKKTGDIASLIVCPICGEGTGVALDRKLRGKCPPQILDEEPCEKCQTKVIYAFNVEDDSFFGYLKREGILTPESLEKLKGQKIAVGVKETEDGVEIVPGYKLVKPCEEQ